MAQGDDFFRSRDGGGADGDDGSGGVGERRLCQLLLSRKHDLFTRSPVLH